MLFGRVRIFAVGVIFAWFAAAASLGAGCGSDGGAPAAGADASLDVTGTPDAAPAADGRPDDALDASPFAPAPHRAWPQLLPHKARVLAPLTLVTIVTQGDPLAAQLFAFSDALTQSAWLKAAGAEYAVGAVAGSAHVTGPAIATAPDRAGLLQYVDDLVTKGSAPAPNGNTLFLVYLPSGMTITGATFASFHGPYPAGDAGLGDGFAVVAHETPSSSETQLDVLTKIASHEIIEAATDPVYTGYRLVLPGPTPWDASVWSSMQSGYVENGDLCERTRTREGAYLYQRSWSNAAALDGGDPCVPPLDQPYVNVSAPADWYPVQPGHSVDIPFSGWSSAATTNWLINVGQTNGHGAFSDAGLGLANGVSVTTALEAGTKPPCFARQAMNNGASGTITVTAPPDAASGDWAVLQIRSFRENPATCLQPPLDDLAHFWPVGVYVP